MLLFGLIDCNNFYVSCERVFNPKLKNKPVVVLSNNDGCVIARSNEAKSLQIAMGEPYFKMKARFPKNYITALSSNYALYGDLSARVMQIISEQGFDVENYSIDESFIRLQMYKNIETDMVELKRLIYQCTGIPVSIGIAPTKVLSKIANHIGKKETISGVYCLIQSQDITERLARLPVKEIWGIAHATTQKLNKLGVYTALDLSQKSPAQMKKQFNVNIERIVYELKGIQCLDLEEESPRKSIISSKSFGNPIETLSELASALSTYTSRACEKLRSQHSVTESIGVFLNTNSFKPEEPQRHVSSQANLPYPTDDTHLIFKVAKKILTSLYHTGFRYKKTGIMLLALQDKKECTQDLWARNPERREQLMQTLDKVNQRFGQNTLFSAVQGTDTAWEMKRSLLSPNYIGNWHSLLKVK